MSTYSPLLTPASTAESSRSIRPSGRELGASGILNCQTSRSMPISKSRTWIRSGFQSSRVRPKMTVDGRGNEERIGRRMSPATSGMMVNAPKRKRTAEDIMSATNAESVDIEGRIARRELAPKRPKYLQRSVWTDADASPSFSPTACCTLTDEPLPRPPPQAFSNVDAVNTVRDNPHLFEIVTPINVS